MDGDLPEGGVAAPTSSASLEELEAQITELAGHLNAAHHRWLTLIAEFDRRHGWSDGTLASCAHWLNFKCGLNLGAAREKVRVAHALEALPHIGAAMARGELSYSKVRALSRVACAATEESLLIIALHGTAHHVETIVRHYRRAQQAEQLSREARQQANRSLHYWYDEDGSLVIKARLPALGGAIVVKALEAAMQEVPSTELCFQERRADALAMLGESYLQRHADSSSNADRYQVVVHVDAETLREQTAGRCHIEQGPSIPVQTVRRIACDSSLVQILETEHGVPLDVGRKTRSIPPAIRRALNARDAGCCFPGCTYRRYLDAHHVEHWADGGETKLSNLVTLCRRHHRLVHEGGIAVVPRDSGGWRFLKPDGREFNVIRPASTSYDWSDLQSDHEAQGIRIDSSTAATRWHGERIDYELGVWGLCHQAERARERRDGHEHLSDAHDVSAETSA